MMLPAYQETAISVKTPEDERPISTQQQGQSSAPLVARPPTGQDEQQSSRQRQLLLAPLRGSADLGALESQDGEQDGGKSSQQGQNHEGPAHLQVD